MIIKLVRWNMFLFSCGPCLWCERMTGSILLGSWAWGNGYPFPANSVFSTNQVLMLLMSHYPQPFCSRGTVSGGDVAQDGFDYGATTWKWTMIPSSINYMFFNVVCWLWRVVYQACPIVEIVVWGYGDGDPISLRLRLRVEYYAALFISPSHPPTRPR